MVGGLKQTQQLVLAFQQVKLIDIELFFNIM